MSSHPADSLLAALGKERATFQTFPDHPQAVGHPTILHGPHKVRASRLAELNRAGHGVFVMVNHGDLQGRRAENVTAVAAYFVDLDGSPLPTTWPLDPTIVIESSPARYHAYWRVTDAPLDAFAHVQKHMALLFDGDPAVHDLPRVMRLPGYQHQKSDAFTTRITGGSGAVYTHAEIMHMFAVPTPERARERRPMPDAVRAYIDRFNKPRNGDRPASRDLTTAAERVMTAGEGQRNTTLYRVAAAVAAQVKAGELPRSEAEHTLEQAGLATGLEPREVKATIRSAMRYAR
jgi:hypothetical protein